MPKIEITEIDNTSPGSLMESTDVVFIPGFVDISQKSLKNSSGEYIGIAANDPQLFTSVSAFETLCGTDAPIFTEDQLYPVDKQGKCLFEDTAVDPSVKNVFIKSNSPDPSYIMAKELLAAGLPVLYQRVNTSPTETTTEYKLISSDLQSHYVKQGLWATVDPDYYYKSEDADAEGNPVYLKYKDVINCPDFNSIKDAAGGSVIAFQMINLIEAGEGEYTPEEILGFYNQGINYSDGSQNFPYYVIDGEIVVGNAEYVSNALPRFENVLLIKVADGWYEECSQHFTDDDGEARALTEDDVEGATFAIKISVTQKPDDWAESFTDYYRQGYTATNAFKYTKVEEGRTQYKNYETGNIFVKEDTTDYSFTVQKMYDALPNIFSLAPNPTAEDYAPDPNFNVSGLTDRGNHSVKYLTSGGYPVFETTSMLANSMIQVAKERGDCVALIDHTDYPFRKLNQHHSESLYQAVKKAAETYLTTDGEFGAMFTPWAEYARLTTDGNIPETPRTFRAPASFAYLAALADSIKTNANWLAIAGVTRGSVRNLVEMTTVIPNGVADGVQPRDAISINAITNIKPYGYTIWGNRTLKDNADSGNLIATSFLNVRNLVSDIKKTCYRVARKLTFEQDTDVLWINFKSEISKLLDQMKSGYGISGYKILRDNTHVRANDKATLCAKVIIYPVEAVEDFYITIMLEDDQVTVN